jgi:AbiJ N-terminal domain 4
MTKRFSERLGITESPAVLQTEGMNDALRNSIWNLLHELYDSQSQSTYWIGIAKIIARYFRKLPVDELPYRDYECRRWVKEYFYSLSWYEIYDITEFICNCINISAHRNYTRKQLEDRLNEIFEREMSGYRVIAGLLAPISNPAETTEISGAIEITSRTGLDGAHHHLQTALALLVSCLRNS